MSPMFGIPFSKSLNPPSIELLKDNLKVIKRGHIRQHRQVRYVRANTKKKEYDQTPLRSRGNIHVLISVV